MQEYTGFVYIWYDRKRKLFCIGSHMGKIDDGYTTYTGIMRKVYRKRSEDFKRRIIYYHNGDANSLYRKEQYFLTMIKEEELFYGSKPRYYNIKPIAHGISGEYASQLRKKYYETDAGKEWLKKLSEMKKGVRVTPKGTPAWNKGIKCESIKIGLKNSPKQKEKWTKKRREERSEFTKASWEKGNFDNRPLQSRESIEKARESRKGFNQTDFQKDSVRKALQKEYIITYPDGTEKQIINMRQFCKENNLDQGNMARVAAGEANHHKKFKARPV